ncbi:MAG: hypothetical protein ACOYNY_10900 [Caldilineaceae bacterium]
MDSLLTYLSNPLINLVAAAIIGAVTNVLTNKFSERSKIAWWSHQSKSLDDWYFKQTSKLRLSYKTEKNSYKQVLGRLYATRLVFWNGGKDVIQHTDIANHQRFLLALSKKNEILEIRPISQTNPTINLIKVDLRTIDINFEYIDAQQGIVFDIVHCGDSVEMSLSGILKGGRVEVKPSLEVSYRFSFFSIISKKKYPQYALRIARWLPVLLAGILLSAVNTLVSALWNGSPSDNRLTLYAMTLQVVIAIGVYTSMAITIWRSPILPKGLEKFYEQVG